MTDRSTEQIADQLASHLSSLGFRPRRRTSPSPHVLSWSCDDTLVSVQMPSPTNKALQVEISLEVGRKTFTRSASFDQLPPVLDYLSEELGSNAADVCAECGREVDEVGYVEDFRDFRPPNMCADCYLHQRRGGFPRFVSSAEEFETLLREPLSIEDAQEWLNIGIQSARDLLIAGERLGYTHHQLAADARAEQIAFDDDQLVFVAINSEPGEHRKWLQAGFTIREMLAWTEAVEELHDFGLRDAKRGRALGLDPSIAAKFGATFTCWLDSGLSATALRELASDESLPLLDTEPLELQRAGVPLTAENVRRWGGLTADEILNAVDVGIASADEAWEHADISTADATRWSAHGFGPRSAAEWVSNGAGPAEAAGWRAAGIDVPTAKEWVDAGATVKSVKSWIDAGFSPSAARRWIKLGLDARDAARWRVAGVDSDTAARRIEAGLGPPPT